jgi:phosphoglycolate phosphatase-like HAD superfamily hydrolase
MPICFDLDGTLGHFSSGFVLLRESLGQLWGEAPTSDELSRCAGSTDWEIVDELHRMRFGCGLVEEGYAAYEVACVARFRNVFAPGGWKPEGFTGILEGMHHLAARHQVWVVSGNAPALLDFKAGALGIAPEITRLGSRPHLTRAGLLRQALQQGPGPHLYVGDRPHDLAAAREVGMPFLGVGSGIPGDHPVLGTDALAAEVVAMASAFLTGW